MATSPFADGLGLDGLNPPHIVTFVSSVPRRVGEALTTVQDAVSDAPDDGDAAVLVRAAGLVDDIVEELTAAVALVTDQVPTPGRDDIRVEARVGELLERLRPLPAAAWGEGDLLSRLRTAVGRIAEPLRQLEHLASDAR